MMVLRPLRQKYYVLRNCNMVYSIIEFNERLAQTETRTMEDTSVLDLIGYTTSQFCPKCKTFLVVENEIGQQWCEDCDWEKSSEEMEECLTLCSQLGYQIKEIE